MIQRLSLVAIFLSIDLHGLIELVLDGLTCRRFHIVERYGRLFGGSLGLESLTLGREIVLRTR